MIGLKNGTQLALSPALRISHCYTRYTFVNCLPVKNIQGDSQNDLFAMWKPKALQSAPVVQEHGEGGCFSALFHSSLPSPWLAGEEQHYANKSISS